MTEQHPIELYYFPTPNGWKVSITLEEMELPYVMKPVVLSKGDQFKPEYEVISPNNKMPAIIDPDGPDGKPVSIFESGAILQYLARKTGKFYGKDERQRIAVEEWLMWQTGGLGPMSGQALHFRQFCDEQVPYAIDRYTSEVGRLYGVMNKHLETRDYLADDYSIADMSCWGWIFPHQKLGQDLNDFPHLKAWFERIGERPAVKKGHKLGAELRASGA
jgi:GSH-dependent disulfide-bond oxidoreductase